jgi:mannosyltransferase OCH1-like enzyme
MRKRFRKQMHTVWNSNVSNNRDFHFHVFDDHDCREFIRTNFDARTLLAYDRLIPGAYKADLWRLCVLYKLGGIYFDLKFKLTGKLSDLVEGLEGPLYVKEIYQPVEGITAIYQAVLIAPVGDPILAAGIAKIVENVEKGYYGVNDLDPTGPILIGRIMTEKDHENTRLRIRPFNGDLQYAIHDADEREFFRQYAEYRLDQANDIMYYGTAQHYRECWRNKNIYKPIA